MKRFDKTRLWEVLNTSDNPSFGQKTEPDDLFDEFIAVVYNHCREEKDMAERARSLNYVRGKLIACAEEYASDVKILKTLLKRAILFIDSEIDLMKMEVEHPERFIVFPEKPAPLARWDGKVNDLIEYTIGPQASGKLLTPSGKPMSYADAIKLLETIFGITISGAYDRKTKILSRQKNTTFQDEMRQVFLEEAKKIDK